MRNFGIVDCCVSLVSHEAEAESQNPDVARDQ
jgi:hypothetical protein